MTELSVRGEIERLLADMRAKVLTESDARGTVFVSALVRQQSLPEVERSLVTPFARATLMGAWANYEARQKGYL